MLRNAKGQVASMDVIISVIAIMLMIGAIIIVSYNLNSRTGAAARYGGVVFGNIEQMSPTFLTDHKIDYYELVTFKDGYSSSNKHEILLGTGHSNSHVLCIFLLNQSSAMNIDGVTHIGHHTCSYTNPCPGYDAAFVNVKPVLMDSEIVNMYVVVCG